MFAETLEQSFRTGLSAGTEAELGSLHAFWSPPDGRLCLQHVRCRSDQLYRPHSHPEYGIVICLTGEVLKTQLGTTWISGPGQVLMSNPGVEHASGYLTAGAGCEAVCLSVEPRAMAQGLAEFRLPALRPRATPLFLGRIDSPVLREGALEVARALRAPGPGQGQVLEALARRILGEALRAWPRHGVEVSDAALRRSLPRREFVRAYDFMRWCRKEAFRVEQLCRFLGTSEERFTRLFQAATHCPPAQFYNQLLMERACTLLSATPASVKEVGADLGFRTSSHFGAVFRRHLGATPQEYRRQLEANGRRIQPRHGDRAWVPNQTARPVAGPDTSE